MTSETLLSAIKETYLHREDYRKAMAASKQSDAISLILDMIKDLTKTAR